MKYIFVNRLINYIKFNWLKFFLIALSLYDLRTDLLLLLDFFTFSTLFYTIFEHPLAITVLIISPTFFNSSKKY